MCDNPDTYHQLQDIYAHITEVRDDLRNRVKVTIDDLVARLDTAATELHAIIHADQIDHDQEEG